MASSGGVQYITKSTKILEVGGFDPSRILISRGGILRPAGDFLEMLRRRILVQCFTNRYPNQKMSAKLCGAHVYCDLKQHNAVVQTRNNIASRKTGDIWALAMYS